MGRVVELGRAGVLFRFFLDNRGLFDNFIGRYLRNFGWVGLEKKTMLELVVIVFVVIIGFTSFGSKVIFRGFSVL